MKIRSLEEINSQFAGNRAPRSRPAPPGEKTPACGEIDIDQLILELDQLLHIEESKPPRPSSFYPPPRKPTPVCAPPSRRKPRISRVILCVCAALCLLTAVGLWAGGFGYSLFRVTSGSMQSEIPKGSLVVTKRIDPRRIITGDNITYRREDGSTVTHKVIAISGSGGAPEFQTQGTDNAAADPTPVKSEHVVGLVVYHAAGLGTLLCALKGICPLLSLTFIIITACLTLWGRPNPEKNPSHLNSAKFAGPYATA